MQITTHTLTANGSVPNNAACPLIVYAQAVALHGPDPASLFEALFAEHGWPPAWRNGIHPYHHFHSTAHEVLGIYGGEVSVCFGGEGGLEIDAKPGDVIVVPAGVGHKRLAVRGQLGVVGAYPHGQRPDLCTANEADTHLHVQTIGRVPRPGLDPVSGAGGPLLQAW